MVKIARWVHELSVHYMTEAQLAERIKTKEISTAKALVCDFIVKKLEADYDIRGQHLRED